MRLRAAEWAVLSASASIAACAAWVGAVVYRNPPAVAFAYRESTAASLGEQVYRREGCSSCHQVFGNGATYGPPLDGEGSRRSAEWLHSYLLDPRPGVGSRPYRLRMPRHDHLSPAERLALVDYLQALQAAGAR